VVCAGVHVNAVVFVVKGCVFSGVERFAKIYAAKMGVDKDKMMNRLWGGSFSNAKKKVWTNVQQPEGMLSVHHGPNQPAHDLHHEW